MGIVVRGQKELTNSNQTTKLFLYPRESYLIRGGCFNIYKKFRNTQKESVYLGALIEELKSRGLQVEKEKQIAVFHLGKKVGVYVPDLVINRAILLELKAKPFLHQDDIKQFWYYLKNCQFQLGFLVNFGESDGVNIIRRVYNKPAELLRSSVSSSE